MRFSFHQVYDYKERRVVLQYKSKYKNLVMHTYTLELVWNKNLALLARYGYKMTIFIIWFGILIIYYIVCFKTIIFAE
jgi:hypothetical protein